MLKKHEIEVVSNLRQDSRQRFTQIAKKTGLHKLTVSGIEKRLREEGIIRHVPMLDFRKIGYSVMINLALVSPDDAIKDYLYSHPNINSLSTVSGKFNLFAECVFKNMKDMHDFLEYIERFNIKDMQYHHMIEEIKKEEFSIMQPDWM